ncbi:hypothetical protein J6590_000489 [Homalodisca vitripennis]|nr:hypothetical protein J6590_000489 [Homalodisca vitripennis]
MRSRPRVQYTSGGPEVSPPTTLPTLSLGHLFWDSIITQVAASHTQVIRHNLISTMVSLTASCRSMLPTFQWDSVITQVAASDTQVIWHNPISTMKQTASCRSMLPTFSGTQSHTSDSAQCN